MTKPADIFIHGSVEESPARNTNFRPIKSGAELKIYPICALDKLIEAIRVKKTDKTTVRYFVSITGQLWFAEEGPPSKSVAAHCQITGDARCMAAGNLVFSEDYRFIVKVNNKSGDYSPSFESIKWFLAILVANTDNLVKFPIDFAPTLIVDKCNTEDTSYTLKTAELIDWVNATFSADKLRSFVTNQPQAIKIEKSPEPVCRAGRFFDDSSDDAIPQQRRLGIGLFAAGPATESGVGAKRGALGAGLFDTGSDDAEREKHDSKKGHNQRITAAAGGAGAEDWSSESASSSAGSARL